MTCFACVEGYFRYSTSIFLDYSVPLSVVLANEGKDSGDPSSSHTLASQVWGETLMHESNTLFVDRQLWGGE